jgi:hypothetical protein
MFFDAESFDSDYRRRIFSWYREYKHHAVNTAPPEIPMAIATSIPASILIMIASNDLVSLHAHILTAHGVSVRLPNYCIGNQANAAI